jgi:hypothetical protein
MQSEKPKLISSEKKLLVPADQQALKLVRSLPHGHVAAALGMLRKLGLDRILSRGGFITRWPNTSPWSSPTMN